MITPRIGPTQMAELPFGVVLGTEPHPPTDAHTTPAHWLLVTSLAVTSVADVLTCVHWYRLRWLVERFPYLLKRGCQVEKLQLEQANRLTRALVIYSVVAAWLLHATSLARPIPNAPSTIILSDDAWRALCAVHYPHRPLPAEPPTIYEAIRLIARLSGFRHLTDIDLTHHILTTVTTLSLPEQTCV